LREERRLRVFENRVLRRIFGPKMNEEQRKGENYIWRSLMICTHQIVFGWSVKKNEMGETCSAYGGKGEVHTERS
jgi:hypothetical protein